jgi:uncharacterized DUF497 family protein
MEIEFDPNKDLINRSRHDGLSLAMAEHLDWDSALAWVDDRFEYDEVRVIALAPDTNELFYVVFVDDMQDEVRRIISLRFATRRERAFYRENFR